MPAEVDLFSRRCQSCCMLPRKHAATLAALVAVSYTAPLLLSSSMRRRRRQKGQRQRVCGVRLRLWRSQLLPLARYTSWTVCWLADSEGKARCSSPPLKHTADSGPSRRHTTATRGARRAAAQCACRRRPPCALPIRPLVPSTHTCNRSCSGLQPFSLCCVCVVQRPFPCDTSGRANSATTRQRDRAGWAAAPAERGIFCFSVPLISRGPGWLSYLCLTHECTRCAVRARFAPYTPQP